MRNRALSLLDYSAKVGSLFGVPIRLHITIVFFLIPALRNAGNHPLLAAELSFLIVLSILAHELGHALVAKKYNLPGLSIMLHGFGGFAMSYGPRSPKQSIRISAAGPAVTLAVGILSLLISKFVFGRIEAIWAGEQTWVFYALGIISIELAFLNMLPMFPLDGGQILAALLNTRFAEVKATRHACHLGVVTGIILAVYSFLGSNNFFLIFALIGITGSVSYLLQSGGIRFGEFFADRKHQKELLLVKKREQERFESFLDDVRSREHERAEQEKLRKLLGED